MKDPTYPGIANDFAETFRRQKAMEVDVWVAAHASQYGLDGKYRPGDAYDPEAFADPEGFGKLVAHYQTALPGALRGATRGGTAVAAPGTDSNGGGMAPETTVEAARRFVEGASRIVGFTGAGISTESGVPDFRSPERGMGAKPDRGL